jgi:Coenzyme PQQ synthesis protein D (PqqD)
MNDLEENLLALFENEFPFRRPENGYRVWQGKVDIRNSFILERYEQLTETGGFILMLCDGNHSIADIWRHLTENFQVSHPNQALLETVRMVRYFQRFWIVYPCTREGEQTLDSRFSTI